MAGDFEVGGRGEVASPDTGCNGTIVSALVKTPERWKIALRHTSMLPPDFGVEVDYQPEHGGAKIAEVSKSGPAGKAGFKSGDVLIEYGGRKIALPR